MRIRSVSGGPIHTGYVTGGVTSRQPLRARLSGVGSALFRVDPHRGAHRVALRAGVSVLVPLLLLTLMGHTGWTVYAAFGAFTSLYGRMHGHSARVGMQLVVAVALTSVVTLGAAVALVPDSGWLSVIVGSLVAMGGALLSDDLGWHPPGPLFLVFAFTVCAAIPGSASTVAIAAAVAAGSALFAVIVGGLGLFWAPSSTLRFELPRLGIPTTLRRPGEMPHLLRYLLASGLAGVISDALGWGHAYWAMVAAVVPMAASDTAGRLVRASHRLAGTLAGLLLALPVLALRAQGVAAVLIIVALQIAAELLVGRNYGLALCFVTPLALMMGQLAHRVPINGLLRDRAWDTVLGVSIGVVVSVATGDKATVTRRSA
jgi:uncharacterized membrane protein YccC